MSGGEPGPRERVEAALARAPLARELGITVVDAAAGRVVLSMPLAARLTQHQGIVHGGLIAALLDTAATMAFLSAAAAGEDVSTIEFKVNFFSPVPGAEGTTVTAEADELHHGRRTRAAEARLISAGRIAARGSFTALVIEARPRVP